MRWGSASKNRLRLSNNNWENDGNVLQVQELNFSNHKSRLMFV